MGALHALAEDTGSPIHAVQTKTRRFTLLQARARWFKLSKARIYEQAHAHTRFKLSGPDLHMHRHTRAHAHAV